MLNFTIRTPDSFPVHARVAACCLVWAGSASTAALAQTPAPPTTASGATAASSPSGLVHVVVASDSVAGICRKYGLAAVACRKFAEHNRLVNNQLPAAGTPVRIPLDALRFKRAQARLVHTVGDVKVNGQAAKSGIRIDENASIATSQGSSAMLEMADGSLVRIMPKSVADIVQNRSYSAPESSTSNKIIDWFAGKMRLTQGAVEAIVNKVTPRAQPLEVQTPTSLIGVRGTEFRVAAADSTVRADRAEVISGTVSNINTWKRSEITLTKGQGAVVNPNVAEMQAVELLQPPKMPAPDQIVRKPEAIWSFPSVPGAHAYRVIAANDANFDNVVYSEKLAGNSADLSGLPNGVWHMRVRGVDRFGLEGLDGDTRIVVKQPSWMLRNASVMRQVTGSPTLVWTALTYGHTTRPIPGASTVKAELSRTPDFSHSTSLTSTTMELPLPNLVSGTYYLRIGVDNAALGNTELQTYRFVLPAHFAHAADSVLLEPV